MMADAHPWSVRNTLICLIPVVEASASGPFGHWPLYVCEGKLMLIYLLIRARRIQELDNVLLWWQAGFINCICLRIVLESVVVGAWPVVC